MPNLNKMIMQSHEACLLVSCCDDGYEKEMERKLNAEKEGKGSVGSSIPQLC